MGYYTAYSLTVHGLENQTREFRDVLKAEIDRMDVFSEHYDEDTWYAPEEKWYEWEQDMCKLSKKFPSLMFELYGDGEEQDDMWRAYFRGGLVQHAPAQIIYDDFSVDKLEEPGPDIDWEDWYSYE